MRGYMQKSRIVQLTCFALLIGGLALIRYPWQPARVEAKSDRSPAPQFTLKDASEKDVKLSDFKGKVVLLNFWATWCGPCKVEIPWFMNFEKVYSSRGLAVIGVSMDEDGWKVVTPYVQRSEIHYPILLGNENVAKLYGGVDSLPMTFLLDRSGNIASRHIGLVGKDTYEREIRQLLDEH